MTAIAVIPARLGSTRLPRKVLVDIAGKPLVRHVWERVRQARGFDAVYIATDAEEVAQVVRGFGGVALMTSPDHPSGTARIAALLDQLDADLIVNVQGDEPLVEPSMLSDLVQQWQSSPVDLITPVYRIQSPEALIDPNRVKVARARNGEAVYFSRSPIPYLRDVAQSKWLEHQTYWGHIGVYGYRRDVLAAYPDLPVSPLETSEKLEQLRFLDAGYRFQTVETTYEPLAVDTQADLEHIRLLMAE